MKSISHRVRIKKRTQLTVAECLTVINELETKLIQSKIGLAAKKGLEKKHLERIRELENIVMRLYREQEVEIEKEFTAHIVGQVL